MGKYLKKFENHSQYQAYTADTSNFILPNVSLCVQENEVHYNPYVDPYGGHDYVEIGRLKWATMNIGATAVTDTGLYFQWGDTQGYTASEVGTGSGQKAFRWADYKYGNGTSSPGATGMTKYNSTDKKTVLDAEDDAVTAAWGGSWRMPTTEEYNALISATTSAWTADYEDSGVAGLVLTSKADTSKKLFFPAAGGCYRDSVNDVGSNCNYWSSSLYLDKEHAYYLFIYSIYVSWSNNNYRRLGYSVRGVLGN